MSLQPLVTSEILFAYFAGQATVLQKQMIERWVEEEPANEEIFYVCLHEWEMKHPQYVVDINLAIEKFNDSILKQTRFCIHPEVQQQHFLTAKTIKSWQKWVVAASIFFVALFGVWLFRDIILYKSYTTNYGETSSITLSDGSNIILNANSILRVPRFGFGNSSRQVNLRGEARFSVVHTPDDKKFVVLTGSGFQVEVLGTIFNLYTRQSGTKLVLQEGEVKVLHKERVKLPATSLIMAKGDLVTFDKNQKKLQIKKVKHPESYSAWQHGRFVFNNTSLAEVKNILYDNYGLAVELQGINLSKKTISGSIKANDANELLYALSTILDINIIRLDNQVILKDHQ